MESSSIAPHYEPGDTPLSLSPQPDSSRIRRLSKPGKLTKRRAAKACCACRARKVRCDITVHGVPCTNCRLDLVDCGIIERRRPRFQPRVGTNALPDATPQITWQAFKSDDTVPSGSKDGTDLEAVAPQGIESGLVVPLANSVRDVALGLTFELGDEYELGAHEQLSGETSCFQDDSISAARAQTATALPRFIQELPQSLGVEDWTYLKQKGALQVPDSATQNEILSCYLSNIYPFMPILRLDKFLGAIATDGESGQVSLLLYQAVMFAGLSAMDPKRIEDMSFCDVKHAWHVFFARVRVLHDLSVEKDNEPVLQSLLLMSLWHDSGVGQKDTWYFTGLALSLAHTLGLHCNTGGSSMERGFRRRLWWSLYIRDRLIALGTRRPMRIDDREHELPLLCVEDFDYGPLIGPWADLLSRGFHEPAREQLKSLSLLCVELTKLCVCVGHVLETQYTTLGSRSDLTATLRVIPRQDQSAEVARPEIDRRAREITEWRQGQHRKVRELEHREDDDPSLLCSHRLWTVLELVRLTLTSLLYRPHSLRQVAPSMNGTTMADPVKSSQAKLNVATLGLSRIAQDLLHRDEVRFLPTSGVSAFLAAALSLLLSLDSRDEDVKDASLFRLSQVLKVLRQLGHIYTSASSAIAYLRSIVHKTDIVAQNPRLMTALPLLSLGSGHLGRESPSPGKMNRHMIRATSKPRVPDDSHGSLVPADATFSPALRYNTDQSLLANRHATLTPSLDQNDDQQSLTSLLHQASMYANGFSHADDSYQQDNASMNLPTLSAGLPYLSTGLLARDTVANANEQDAMWPWISSEGSHTISPWP